MENLSDSFRSIAFRMGVQLRRHTGIDVLLALVFRGKS
jgi:hypothetical protein